MKKDIQTPNPDETPGEEIDIDPLTGKPKGKGTGEGKEGIDYKEKFAASTREAQRLTIAVADERRAKEEERKVREALEKDQEEYLKILGEEQPDSLRILKLEKELRGLREDALLGKEARDLNDFVDRNPDAKDMKEMLRSLGRANPDKSYGTLWDETLLPTLKGFLGKTEGEKKKTPETGKGAISTAPEGEIDVKAFRKLPLEKRKKILKKALGQV